MIQLSKKTNLILAIITFIAAATFLGCDLPAKKADTAKENLTKTEDDYKIEIANFKKASNELIAANEIAIANFKTQMAIAKKDVKASYEKEITILEKKNSDLQKSLNDFNEDSSDKWQTFKEEFNHDMDELGKSLKDFTVDNKK